MNCFGNQPSAASKPSRELKAEIQTTIKQPRNNLATTSD